MTRRPDGHRFLPHTRIFDFKIMKRYTVRVSPSARDDLALIVLHIARGNADAASQFVAKLRASAETVLSTFPLA
jgi:plasmid stabilization system protein ParE